MYLVLDFRVGLPPYSSVVIYFRGIQEAPVWLQEPQTPEPSCILFSVTFGGAQSMSPAFYAARRNTERAFCAASSLGACLDVTS